MTNRYQILVGDVIEQLATLPEVRCKTNRHPNRGKGKKNNE